MMRKRTVQSIPTTDSTQAENREEQATQAGHSVRNRISFFEQTPNSTDGNNQLNLSGTLRRQTLSGNTASSAIDPSRPKLMTRAAPDVPAKSRQGTFIGAQEEPSSSNASKIIRPAPSTPFVIANPSELNIPLRPTQSLPQTQSQQVPLSRPAPLIPPKQIKLPAFTNTRFDVPSNQKIEPSSSNAPEIPCQSTAGPPVARKTAPPPRPLQQALSTPITRAAPVVQQKQKQQTDSKTGPSVSNIYEMPRATRAANPFEMEPSALIVHEAPRETPASTPVTTKPSLITRTAPVVPVKPRPETLTGRPVRMQTDTRAGPSSSNIPNMSQSSTAAPPVETEASILEQPRQETLTGGLSRMQSDQSVESSNVNVHGLPSRPIVRPPRTAPVIPRNSSPQQASSSVSVCDHPRDMGRSIIMDASGSGRSKQPVLQYRAYSPPPNMSKQISGKAGMIR